MASPPSPSVSSPPPTNSSLTSPPQLSSIAPLTSPSSPPPPPLPTNSSQPPPTPSDPPSPPPPLPSNPPSPPPPLPSSPPPNNQPPPVNNSPPPPQISPTPPNNSPPPELPNSPPPPSTPLPAQNSSQAPPQLLQPPNSPISPLPSNSSPLPIPRISPPPPSAVPSRTTPPSQSLVPPVSLSTNGSTHSSLQNSQSSNGGGIGTDGTIGIALVLGLVLLGILGTIACCLWKRKKKATGRSGGLVSPAAAVLSSESDSDSKKVQILSSSYHRSNSGNGNAHTPRTPSGLRNLKSSFTYEELMEATNGFSTQNLLGEGGFGSVYRGNLEDGREVAVKKLKIGGGQGEREFRSEVEIISRVHHRHLVSIVGYCIYEEGRILVYDYVPNNNLYHHLHGEDRRVLDWVTRVKIALGAARGIAYLHEDCHPRIIHRDIKSSNILVDNNFEARVSDFGLAILAMDANTHVTTRVMGTFGYMAPEYASSGKLTEKSDVYSFGVVLLELITGHKPVDSSRPLGDESLVEWARPLLSHALETHEFNNLADPRLEGNYVEGEMFRMVEAAAACVRHSSAKRPKMGQLVRAFDSMSSGDLSNGMKVGESDVFNQAESAQVRMFQKMVFGNGDVSTDLYPLQHSFTSDDDEASPSVNRIQ